MAASSLLSRTRTLGQSDLDKMALKGADLRGVRLLDVDLSGREMAGVDLRRATLVRVRMCGADLRKADFRECELRSVDLSTAKLQDAKLDRAHAKGLVLREADLSGASLSGLYAPQANFCGASLRGADLRQARLEFSVASSADLGSVQAQGVALDGARLDGAELSFADLSKATLEDADLSGATLEGLRLRGARLTGLRLEDAHVQGLVLHGVRWPKGVLSQAQEDVLGLRALKVEPLSPAAPEDTPESVATPSPKAAPVQLGPGASLAGMDLSGQDLRGRDLSGADLQGARLVRTDLREARLDGALLAGANLSRARLEGASLRALQGAGVQLVDANLRGADLRGARLQSANLAGARLTGTQLAGAQLLQADLRGADLSKVDLAGADLRGAELAGADLDQAKLGGALLEISDLEGAYNLRPSQVADLRGAVREEGPERSGPSPMERLRAGAERGWMRAGRALREVPSLELPGIPETLRLPFGLPPRLGPSVRARPPVSALRSGADLSRADLRGRVLVGVDLAGADLRGALLSGARLSGCSLAGADLRGARLQGASLRGVSLASARVAGVLLQEAVLQACDLRGADLAHALAQGARFEGCQWRGASLQGAKLSGTDLRGAALLDADLRGASLDQASLRGADLDGVLVAGADFGRSRGLSAAQRAELHQRGALLEGGLWDALAARWTSYRVAAVERALARELSAAEEPIRVVEELVPAREHVAPAFEEVAPPAVELAPAVEEVAPPVEHIARPVEEAARPVEEAAPPVEVALPVEEAAPPVEVALPVEEAASPVEVALPVEEAALSIPDLVPPVEEPVPREAEPALEDALAHSVAPAESQAQSRSLLQVFIARIELLRNGPALPELLPGADLAGLDLRRAELDGVDLQGADLSGARLSGARLQDTVLNDANLSGADLRGARLDGVVLIGANLEGARVDEARFSGCDLHQVRAKGSSWAQARVARCRLDGLDWRESELSGAHLMELSLDGVDLRGAQMDQADLSGSELQGARLDGVDLTGALGVELQERGQHVAVSLPIPWIAGAAVGVLSLGVLAVLIQRIPDLPSETLEAEAAQAQAAGELEEAVARWQDLAEGASSPEEATLYRREQAALLARTGQLEEAFAVYLLAQEGTERADDQAEIFLRLGDLALRLGEEARPHYQAVVALAEAPASAVALALVALEDLGDEPSAAWIQAQGSNSGRVQAVSLAAAQGLGARGEIQRALDWLELEPQDAVQRRALHAARAEVLRAGGQPGAAFESYTLALQGRVWKLEDGTLRLRAAELQAESGDAPGAREALDELTVRPAHPWVRDRARLLLAELSPDSEALPLLELVLASEDRDLAQAAEVAMAQRLGPQAARQAAEVALLAGDAERAGWLILAQAKGDPVQAETLIQEVLGLETSAGLRQAAQLDLADLLQSGGDTEGAIRALRALRAEAEPEQQGELDARIAQALLEAGRFDDARFAFDGLLEQSPPGSEAALRAQLGVAQVDESQGALEQARMGYQAVLAQEPPPELRRQALYSLAGNALERGDAEGALSLWQQSLQALPPGHPGDFSARLAVADLLRARGQNGPAQRVLEQAQTQDPSERAWQQIALAEIAEEQGDLARAETIYLAMLADPELPSDEADPVVAGLARVRAEPLAEAEDPGEGEWLALQEAQVLLDEDPHAGVKQLESLREAQDTEVRIQALLVLAGLALDAGETQAALADLALAQQSTESDHGVWQAAITALRVQALLELGKRDQAVLAWEQALDRSAGNEDLASQAGLGLGELALSEGQAQEAQGYFEGVLSSAQDRGWKERARLGRARARIEAGDFSGAQEDLERVLRSEETELAVQAQELLDQLPD